MPTIIASDGQCLAPSDNSTYTTAEIARRIAAGDTRYQGATHSDLDVPVGKNYNDYILSGGAIVAKSTLFTVENLQAAATRYHQFLESLSARLEGQEAKIWLSHVVQKGHDWVAELHYGANVIVGRRVPSCASLTIEQRINWCNQGLLGPSDIRAISIADIAARVHKIYQALVDTNHTAPIIPVTYIDPRNATPVSMQAHDSGDGTYIVDAIALSGTGSYTDTNGDSQTGLGLDAITDFSGNHSVDVHGSWINNLSE